MIPAVVAAVLPAHARNRAALIAGLSTLAGLIGLASRFPEVRDGGVVVERIAWVPAIGLDLLLRLDGLTWIFGVLVLGIGALVILYARYYLSPSDPAPRFYAFLLAFIAAMLGTVLSGNLLQLAFFWELTSLLSFLLIGYWQQRLDAQRGARMALTVTAMGGLCLLAGLILLGQIAGSYELDGVLAAADRVKVHRALPRRALPHFARRLHEERPVPVSLLAAQRDGGAHPRVRLPAFGDHGEAGGLPAGSAVAGALGHAAVVLDRRIGRAGHAAGGRLGGAVPPRPQGAARLFDDLASRPHRLAARAQQPRSRRWRRCFTSSTTRRSRRRCSWRSASSTTRRGRGTCGGCRGCFA